MARRHQYPQVPGTLDGAGMVLSRDDSSQLPLYQADEKLSKAKETGHNRFVSRD
ncbi:MAG: hypothetical protein H7833_08950 [Magnetococcus sp. DMHC-1]